MTKRIVFIHGDKGGVGKSTFARLLAAYYEDQKIPWHGFDTDNRNGHLYRFYPAQTTPLLLRETASIDQIAAAVDGDKSPLLVDLGARSGDILEEWMQQISFFEMKKKAGFQVTMVFLLSAIKDSTALLKAVIEQCGDQVDYVIVKNLALSKTYSIYDASKTRIRLKELKAVEIEMYELLAYTYEAVDSLNLSWADALVSTDLNSPQRSRVFGFLSRGYKEIEKAKDYLL